MGKIFKAYLSVASSTPIMGFVFILGPHITIVAIFIVSLCYFPITTILIIAGALFLGYKNKKIDESKEKIKKSKEDEELQIIFSKINASNKTDFKIENAFGFGNAVFFDKVARKFLFIDLNNVNNSVQKVVDFSFIRGWKLHWIEQSHNNKLHYSSVVMKITTNDISNPLIEVLMNSKEAGEKFEATLDILLA